MVKLCHRTAHRNWPSARTKPDYGAYLNWLQRGDATLTFPQALVLRYTRLPRVR